MKKAGVTRVEELLVKEEQQQDDAVQQTSIHKRPEEPQRLCVHSRPDRASKGSTKGPSSLVKLEQNQADHTH